MVSYFKQYEFFLRSIVESAEQGRASEKIGLDWVGGSRVKRIRENSRNKIKEKRYD